MCVECLIGKQKKPILFQVTDVCVECLIGKQKKPILFKVTEPSSICHGPFFFLFFFLGPSEEAKKASAMGPAWTSDQTALSNEEWRS